MLAYRPAAVRYPTCHVRIASWLLRTPTLVARHPGRSTGTAGTNATCERAAAAAPVTSTCNGGVAFGRGTSSTITTTNAMIAAIEATMSVTDRCRARRRRTEGSTPSVDCTCGPTSGPASASTGELTRPWWRLGRREIQPACQHYYRRAV